MKAQERIFGIGMHKTGLTSLKVALEILGYNVIKGKQAFREKFSEEFCIEMLNDNVYHPLLECISQYDAVIDNPWNVLFKILDVEYPNSKFILTIREEGKWIESLKKYFDLRPKTPMRKWIYKTHQIDGNESIHISRYKKHNMDVLDYFKDRRDQLLVMDFSKNDGWEKLCVFLDKPVLDLEFPHWNKNMS